MKYNAEMFLFARWISTSYADEHIDLKGRSQYDENFDSQNYMSALNMKDGYWWAEKLQFFNKQVLPNYKDSGVVKETAEFLLAQENNLKQK